MVTNDLIDGNNVTAIGSAWRSEAALLWPPVCLWAPGKPWWWNMMCGDDVAGSCVATDRHRNGGNLPAIINHSTVLPINRVLTGVIMLMMCNRQC